jgi:hypothetical protein
MKPRVCFALFASALAISQTSDAQIFPLDLPLTAACPRLFSVDFDRNGRRELVAWTEHNLASEAANFEMSTWQMQAHGRLHRVRPSYSDLRSVRAVELWSEGEPHFLLVGTRRSGGSSFSRIQSVSGLDGELVLERPVATSNSPHGAVLLASRSPVDFDFAVSAPGELHAYRSTFADPTWTQALPGSAKTLGRADIDGDGINEILVGTGPVTARSATTGELVWTGTSHGADGFASADLDGDGQPEVIVVGGSPAVAIYGGSPLTLTGSWDDDGVRDFVVHDADGDGVDELLVAAFGGGVHSIDAQGDIARTLLAGRDVLCVAAHTFTPEAGEQLIASASGYAQSTVITVSSLLASATDEPTIVPLAHGPYARIELAEFTQGELSIAHSFFHPFGLETFPRASGVRVVSAASGRILYESESWQRRVVDFAVSSPSAANQARKLWMAGAPYPPYEHAWLQAIHGSDFGPLQGRVFPEFGSRRPHSIFMLPAANGVPELILLLTIGSTGEDIELLAHLVDPDSLTVIGSPLALGPAIDAAAQLIDIDDSDQPELISRTFDAISARGLPAGDLRWQIPTQSHGLAFAVNTAHSPAVLAYRQDFQLVLRDLRTADLLDTIEMPFEILAIGAGDVDPDLILLAEEKGLWEYSISARTLTRVAQNVGSTVGHLGNIQAVSVEGTPNLLIGSSAGLWSYGTPVAKWIFRNSFEAVQAASLRAKDAR